MTTAFVLSGGGSLGAVQVGMLQALRRHGIAPDLLVGASAGALNAAFVAGHGFNDDALDRLAEAWCGVRRRDVFPFAPQRQLLAIAGARPSLCSPDGLRHVIAEHVAYDRLEAAAISCRRLALHKNVETRAYLRSCSDLTYARVFGFSGGRGRPSRVPRANDAGSAELHPFLCKAPQASFRIAHRLCLPRLPRRRFAAMPDTSARLGPADCNPVGLPSAA